MIAPDPKSLTDRFATATDGLYGAVAARVSPRFTPWPLPPALIHMICRLLRRTNARVQWLLARIADGTLGPEPQRRSRAGEARPDPKPDAPPRARLPWRFGWLIPLVPYVAAGYASQFRYLLAEPEMQAMIAASRRLRHALRPLCRMLGIERSLLTPKPMLARDNAPASVPPSAPSYAVAVQPRHPSTPSDSARAATTVAPAAPLRPPPLAPRMAGEAPAASAADKAPADIERSRNVGP